MREIIAKKITETIEDLCKQANYNLDEDYVALLNSSLAKEESSLGREVLRQIIHNAEIAKKEKRAMCQDTGIVMVFMELGENVRVVGGDIYEAINEGVSRGYKNLRKSVVRDPFLRVNTNDNTPAIVYIDFVPGDKLKISLIPKGAGSENGSFFRMFLPSTPFEEIADCVVEKVKKIGPNLCPPLTVGMGLGGTFDRAALLSKKALLRKPAAHHPNHDMAEKEKYLLKLLNKTGIGPMGVGGKTTCLQVNIETSPCHIASFPCAVSFNCHAHRVKEAVL